MDEPMDDKRLLIADDDKPFRERLARAMEQRGFSTILAEGYQDGLDQARNDPPPYAIVDMRLGDGNGVELVGELRDMREDMRIIILTGYGNIASAVAAVKTGAVDYLAKPADPDDVVKALTSVGQEHPEPPEAPMSADRVRWEHIQRVYELCDRNVSETARRLKMHRRTLQRILAKRSPR
jgi:two-component system response regulator RegA